MCYHVSFKFILFFLIRKFLGFLSDLCFDFCTFDKIGVNIFKIDCIDCSKNETPVTKKLSIE